MSLSVLPKLIDQHPVLDRAGVSMAFTLLKDNGIIDEENKELIIGRSKVKQEREKERRNN